MGEDVQDWGTTTLRHTQWGQQRETGGGETGGNDVPSTMLGSAIWKQTWISCQMYIVNPRATANQVKD